MGVRARIFRILVTAALAGIPAAAGATTWAIQSVDVGSNSGTATSVGLVQGFPVIAYFGAPRSLKYAAMDHRSPFGWKLRLVDAGGEYTSLAVDAAGIVHVGYIDDVTHQLKYYANNGTQSIIQVIDSETGQGGMGFFNSIQVDASGVPHISYYYWRSPDGTTTSDRLKFADGTGSGWTPAFADPQVGRGRYNSLAVDATGSSPVIAYYDGGGPGPPTAFSRKLRLAGEISRGTWVSLVVDSVGDPGRFNSIALDASAREHLSYIAATPLLLRYATYTGAAWVFEDVAPVGTGGTVTPGTSLALDGSGVPHIAFYDGAAGKLKYALRNGANNWTVETVDSLVGGDVGSYCSLKLDGTGRPIISYYDATNQMLKIAYGNYPDGDSDGIPDAFDAFPVVADHNKNGIPDGKEGGVLVGTSGIPRLPDEPIFGCGSLAALYVAKPPGGGPPPADLLFLVAPAAYVLLRRSFRRRA
jgi:hypothetical protein